MFKDFHIDSDRHNLQWTNKLPLNAFVEQLNKNLIRKYNSYNEEIVPKDTKLFRSFKFKNFALVPFKKGKISGSFWEFGLNTHLPILEKLINFGLDTGFGEKNSAGFGFMNVGR
jgi:CRISPR-associated endoribonuclease Cas6